MSYALGQGQEKEDWSISTVKEQKEPAEKAFMEFLADRGDPGEGNSDKIPEVSLMYYEGREVILLQGVALPDVDKEVKERGLWKKGISYRIDCLAGGKPGRIIGTMKAGDGAGTFLKSAIRKAASSGNAEAQALCSLLEQHMALCGMERLAREEIARQGQAGGIREDSRYLQANASYYDRLLSYVKEARRALNMQHRPALPPFPERGPFMAAWYRSHRRGGKGHED